MQNWVYFALVQNIYEGFSGNFELYLSGGEKRCSLQACYLVWCLLRYSLESLSWNSTSLKYLPSLGLLYQTPGTALCSSLGWAWLSDLHMAILEYRHVGILKMDIPALFTSLFLWQKAQSSYIVKMSLFLMPSRWEAEKVFYWSSAKLQNQVHPEDKFSIRLAVFQPGGLTSKPLTFWTLTTLLFSTPPPTWRAGFGGSSWKEPLSLGKLESY